MFCYLHKDDNFKLNLEPLFSEVMNGVEEIMFLELTKSWRAIFGFKKLNKKNISSVVYYLNFHHCDCRPLGLSKNIDLSMHCNLFFSFQ